MQEVIDSKGGTLPILQDAYKQNLYPVVKNVKVLHEKNWATGG